MPTAPRWSGTPIVRRGPESPLAPDEQLAFDAYCRENFRRGAWLVALAAVGCVLAWAPTDGLVFRDQPLVLAVVRRWRLVVIAATLGYVLLAPLVGRGAAFVVSVLGVCFASGDGAATAGGLEQPYFYLLNVLSFVPVHLPLTLRRRLALTGAIGGAIAAGFFGLHPQRWSSMSAPMALSFLVFTLLVAVVVGHHLFVLRRGNFVQARELASYSQHLEARVEARTAELRHALAVVETARDSERTRVSRELHDEIGQLLTALRYALAHTRRRYQAQPVDIAANLGELDTLLERAGETTRRLLRELRPILLDELGLVAAVERLLAQTEAVGGLACHLTVRGRDDQLRGERAAVAFRVVQEALTNTVRHAVAAAVTVELAFDDDGVAAVVRDDGGGFDPRQVTRGLGLIGMRERAEQAGGELAITSDDHGTQVRLFLSTTPSANPARGGTTSN